jgi:hypothetical protein
MCKKKIAIFFVGIFLLTNVASVTALSISIDVSKSKIYSEKRVLIDDIKFFNDPPAMLSIEGPTEVTVNIPVQWTFNARDHDSYYLMFFVDWGDGRNSRSLWIPADVISFSTKIYHMYTAEGNFVIEAHAVDWEGGESNHLTLPVTAPTNKAYIVFPFLSFLENHQNAFPMLRHLLGN